MLLYTQNVMIHASSLVSSRDLLTWCFPDHESSPISNSQPPLDNFLTTSTGVRSTASASRQHIGLDHTGTNPQDQARVISTRITVHLPCATFEVVLSPITRKSQIVAKTIRLYSEAFVSLRNL